MNKLLEQINTEKKSYRLSDFAVINPKVILKKDTIHPFLDMSEIEPLQRIPSLENSKIFKGSGSRFESGDTLFARITPCLENGKITRVLNTKGSAFGSTELIVLRGKAGVSDGGYVYYLTQTNNVRRKAEQSMIGASGRQRVERTAFEKIEIFAPSVQTQKKISELLGFYDSKIENNNKIIKNIERTAQTIFKEWFVNFKFPGYEKLKMVDHETGKIPEGWNVLKLKDIFTLVKGKKPLEVSNIKKENFLQQILIDSFEDGKKLFADKNGMIVATDEDLLMVMDGASSGRIEFGISGVVGSTLSKLVLKRPIRTILYFYLKSKEKDIKENTTGSAIPHTDKDKVYNYEIILPQNADYFEKRLFKFIDYIIKLKEENTSLKLQRDRLLAKLI